MALIKCPECGKKYRIKRLHVLIVVAQFLNNLVKMKIMKL